MTISALTSLDRVNYLEVGDDPVRISLDYLSAKYKHIRFVIPAASTFTVTHGFERNAPGIAHEIYRNQKYWPYLMLYNGVVDPVEDVVLGLLLQIPSKEDIDSLLNAEDTSELTAVTI